MSGITISVIIVSYKNRDVIGDCIRSIRENNDIGDRLEVIIVEQSPDDRLFRELSEDWPRITVLRAENRGFGAGNNIGARQAKGSILFFLNPDTVVREPLFAFIESRFREDPQLGLAGVHMVNAAGENISYNMRIPYGLAAKMKYVVYRKADRFQARQMYIEGADLIVRREAYQQAGGFDEAIFMYMEETDLCRRIEKAGYRIRYFPEKTIVHLQGKSTDDRYPAVFGKQLDAFIYVSRKHEVDYRKWLKREARYQGFRAGAARLAGKRADAEQAKRLQQIVKDRIRG